ncbi:Outer membrane protein assembly factor BamB [Candidatus Methanoperedenaceae archaeon GB50]|nr:Outer membrane protein assembly factor BamB [Candidatus Methanoperedenaceae archaeon GB50]CAD7778348.1 MAG: Outer membrane protein assembly factor BamB [Candidatus Methanoperedenaceae archaeon GB50]
MVAVFLISLFIFPLVSADLRKDLSDSLPLGVRSPSDAETLVCGYLFYRGTTGSVEIRNFNKSLSWNARILDSNPDFYYLYLNSSELQAGDTIRIDATSGGERVAFNHTVSESEIASHILWLDLIEDLAVIDVVMPDLFVVNESTGISSTIGNIGRVSVVDQFNITVSVDDEILNATAFVDLPLNPGENVTLRFDWTPLEAGSHTLRVAVDPEGAVVEGDSSNNLFLTDVEVVESLLPDLLIARLDLPSLLFPNSSVWINLSILNAGWSDVKRSFNVTIESEADGELIGSEVIDGLPAGEFKNVSILWSPVETGRYTLTLIVTIDPEDAIEECDEENNRVERTVNIIETKVIRVPEDYDSIQGAIDASYPGWAEIVVSQREDGKPYNEPIMIPEEFSHVSLTADGTVVLRYDGGTLITILGDNCTVQGFDLRDGWTGGTYSNYPDPVIRLCSDHNTIRDNYIYYTWGGIYLENSSYNTIENNTIGEGVKIPIAIWGNKSIIVNNTVIGEKDDAISLLGATHESTEKPAHQNILRRNVFYEYIQLEGSDNLIYDNIFLSPWVECDSEDNIYNTTKIPGTNVMGGPYLGGNYWASYRGVDDDGDGIGDTPYLYDERPLVQLKPDLLVTDVACDNSSVRNVTARVVNNGTANASIFNVSLKVNGRTIDEKYVDSLNLSEETSVNFTWTPSRPGNYNLQVIADTSGLVDEVNETNNEKSLEVVVGETLEPDLTPLSLSPLTFYRNHSNVVSVKVGNIGGGDATQGFNLSLFLNDTLIASKTIDSLNASEVADVEFNCTPEPEFFGNYIMRAWIDSDNQIIESDETNNNITMDVSVVNVPEPDLIVTGIEPLQFVVNETGTVRVTINNSGFWGAEAFNVSIFVNGSLTGIVRMDALAAESGLTAEFGWTPTSTGRYNLTARVDPDDSVDELDEANNNMTVEVRVTDAPMPDLTVNEIGVPDVIYINTSNIITAIIRNAGTNDTGTFNISLCENSTTLSTIWHDSIPPGTNEIVELYWAPSRDGNHTIRVDLDTSNEVGESNEANNWMERTVTVEPEITVGVLIECWDKTAYYEEISIKEGSSILDATERACFDFSIAFDQKNGVVTRIDGVFDPYLYRYNRSSEAWDIWAYSSVSSLTLNDSDLIAWTSGDIPPPIKSDLTPIEIVTPVRTYVNFTNMLGVRVENKGLIEAENFNITLAVDGEIIGSEKVDRIEPRELIEICFEWMPNATGNFTLIAVVDPTNEVDELSEDNNEIVAGVEVENVSSVDVPGDYQTIQDAIDHSPDGTRVHLAGGEYVECPELKIINRQDLMIIGESREDTRIYTELKIKDSDNVVLSGLTISPRERWCSDTSEKARHYEVLSVRNSSNITISDCVLRCIPYKGWEGGEWTNLTGISLHGSRRCTISKNIIYGGTQGIYIDSNSTMNTLTENSITIELTDRLAGVEVAGSNNAIHHNNLYTTYEVVHFHDDTPPYTEVCAAASDDGLNNSWNHNYWGYYLKEIFNEGDANRRYEVSSWSDACRGSDRENDGAYDHPYRCPLGGRYDNVTSIEDVPTGSLRDDHPLVRPAALIETGVDAIVVPSRIYAGQMNTIIGILKRRGDDVAPRSFNATLKIEGEGVDQRSVRLDGWLSEPETKGFVRFEWRPTDASDYNLSVRVEEWTGDPADNELAINVTVVNSSFEGEYSERIRDALDYLHREQLIDGSIRGGLSETPWVVMAITAGGENPHEWGRLIDYLREYPSENYRSGNQVFLTPSDLAAMVLAISSAGEDPRDFGGMNYVLYLKSYYDGEKMGYDNTNYDPCDDALTILALISAGESPHSPIIQSLREHLIRSQRPDGSWEFTHHPEGGRVSHTAIAIQALASAGYAQDTSVTHALDYLHSVQNDDGGFPDESGYSNSLATARAIQAIISAGENPDSWRSRDGKTPVDCLTGLQHSEGYFKKIDGSSPSSSRVPCTSAAVTALAGRPYPLGILKSDSPRYPDMHPIGGIETPSEIYVKTNATLKLRVKSNGGRFNVTLLADGRPVDEETVRTVWADDDTEVVFTWKPDHGGVYNLTALIDPDNRIIESDEENNRAERVVSVSLPDLYPSTIELGTNIVNMVNLVNVRVAGMTDEAFNLTLEDNGEMVDEKRLYGLKGSKTVSFEWKSNETGVHLLTATVDSGHEISESCEENNRLSRRVSVVLPDLRPARIDIPEVYSNATNPIDLQIDGVAERFNLTLSVNGTIVDRETVSSVYADSELSARLYWTPNRTGRYDMRVFLDSDDDVRELDEKNNNITRVVEVILPDLTPIGIKSDEHVFANETNQITVEVRGAGNGFNATLTEIRGNNTEVIGNATNISFYGETSIEFEWVPEENGSHNLTVCLDPDCDLPESNETNNEMRVEIPVYDRIPIILKNPRGGERVSGDLEIRWEISYDKPVTIDLAYSPNGGESWVKIKENLKGSSYHWDTRGLIDGFQYMIKIIAKGEYAYGEDRSDLFMIHNMNEEAGTGLTTTRYFLSTAPDNKTLAWVSPDIGANPSSSIIVADGKVFVYCKDGHIASLNESDGEVEWNKEIAPPEFGSWATPAYHDGYVFIASGNPGRLYSIDADTGDIEWSWEFPDKGASINSGPCIRDGKIFIGSTEGHYYAVSERHKHGSIEQYWSFPAGGLSTPAAAYGNVYFGAPDEDRFYAVDADNGTEVWKITTTAGVYGSPTVANGVVYAATCAMESGSDNLYAIDAIRGSIRWQCGEVLPTDSAPAYTPWGYLYITGGYDEAATYCLNAATGNVTWKNETVGWWTNSPAVSADKKVFVGKSSGKGMHFEYKGLYCLDAMTGEEIWHSNEGGSSPFIANGRVYTTGGGRVYAFGSKDHPDLIPLKITTDPLIYENTSTTINVSVKNVGGAPAGAFNVTLSCKREGSVDKTELQGSITYLKSQKTNNVSFEWTPAEPGNYSIQAMVDPEQTVNEEDNTNNILRREVEVQPMPETDLTVTSLDAPSSLYVGESCQIRTEIRNLGEPATEFDVSLAADGAEIGVRSITELGFMENEPLEFTWTPSSPGTYTLTIFADCYKRISEPDEGNNMESIEVRVQKPLPELGPIGGGGWGGESGNGTGNGSGTGDQRGEMVIPINTTDSSMGDKIRKALGRPFVKMASDEAMSAGGMSGGKLYTLIIMIAIALSIVVYGFWRETRFTGRVKRRR